MISISRNGWSLHLVQDVKDFDSVNFFFHSLQLGSLVGLDTETTGLDFIKNYIVGVCLSAFNGSGVLYNLQSFDLVDFVGSKNIKDPLIGCALKSTLGARFSVGSLFVMIRERNNSSLKGVSGIYEIRCVVNNKFYVDSAEEAGFGHHYVIECCRGIKEVYKGYRFQYKTISL